MTIRGTLAVTGDDAADALINEDPLALLIGMLLDQQIPMEWAFKSPMRLADRLDEGFTAAEIASMDTAELETVFSAKPALHRFPAAMARRSQDLCAHIVERYDGRPERIWEGAESGGDLFERVRELPGYGEEKAMIFVALLAKRFGVAPSGWQRHAGAFADGQPRSVADIDGPEALGRVRAWKKAQKAAGLSKRD